MYTAILFLEIIKFILSNRYLDSTCRQTILSNKHLLDNETITKIKVNINYVNQCIWLWKNTVSYIALAIKSGFVHFFGMVIIYPTHICHCLPIPPSPCITTLCPTTDHSNPPVKPFIIQLKYPGHWSDHHYSPS